MTADGACAFLGRAVTPGKSNGKQTECASVKLYIEAQRPKPDDFVHNFRLSDQQDFVQISFLDASP